MALKDGQRKKSTFCRWVKHSPRQGTLALREWEKENQWLLGLNIT
jgi:hypothetical protein